VVSAVEIALLGVGVVFPWAFRSHSLKRKHYEGRGVCSLIKSRERGQPAGCGVARGFRFYADVSIATDGVGECGRSAGQHICFEAREGSIRGRTWAQLAGFRSPRLRMNAIRVAG
jgi:hypothetical protein